MTRALPETAGYGRLIVLVNAVVSTAVALLAVWLASGFAVDAERVFRVGPTIEQRGVGADWVTGNTIPALDFLIAFIHAADVLMGVFILMMVFIHWGAFRRLAARMRQPGERASYESGDVAADGGRTADAGADPDAGADSDTGAADRRTNVDSGGDRR